jgi:hypothetical protein
MNTYTATAPDGTEVSRKSNNPYAFAVLCQHPEGSSYAGSWAYGFTTRRELALKDYDKQIRLGYWSNVVIVDAKVGA